MAITRQQAAVLDADDELAPVRERFALPAGVIYLDGNSLGALPRHVPARLARAVEDEWGQGLIRSWNDAGWIDAARRTGARIARLIGAAADEVSVADSTSVNLFKLMVAGMRQNRGRTVLLTQHGNFPTDLYIAQSVAEMLGISLRYAGPGDDALLGSLDRSVGVVALSHIDYRSGRIQPMHEICAAARAVGAFTLWDLSHSAGVTEVALDAAGADFAVGCGYKYLNGGPGAPAFAFAARRHHDRLRQPLSGWLGHEQPFTFAETFAPAPGIDRLQCGTPPMLSLLALESALDIFDGVDVAAMRAKSVALGEFFIRLVDNELAPFGFTVVSPRDAATRGSQVSLAHAQGFSIMQALIARGIIGDFRAPDIVRFGFAPLYVRYVDVFDAVEAAADVMRTGAWKEPRYAAPKTVT